MRWGSVVVLLAATAGWCQTLVVPAKVPAAEKYLGSFQNDKPLSCHVQPIPPHLSYSFRMQAGYVVTVPLKQYRGPNHALAILAKVTPEGHAPSYFASGVKLP